MIPYVFNDGGREAAGFRGRTTDCVTRAIAIVTGMPYIEVYDLVNEAGKRERLGRGRKHRSSARTGVQTRTINRVLHALGFEWVPTMQIGSGCKTHMRADELPGGRIIVRVSKHLAAVVDGVLHDSYDSSRGGTRCVYGYWKAKAATAVTP